MLRKLMFYVVMSQVRSRGTDVTLFVHCVMGPESADFFLCFFALVRWFVSPFALPLDFSDGDLRVG